MTKRFVEKAEIYRAAIDYCEGNITLAKMIDELPPAKIIQAEEFISWATDILIAEGQMDTKRFEWGESIRYTPSEIREILLANLSKSNLDGIEVWAGGEKTYLQLTAEAVERGI